MSLSDKPAPPPANRCTAPAGAKSLESPTERLRHDLAGPLLTARGFVEELSASCERSRGLLKTLSTRMDKDTLSGLQFEIDEEMRTCLSHIDTALAQLDRQIEKIR